MSEQGFHKLKYKDKIYNVGDHLILRESNVKILVWKLLEIIPYGGLKDYEEWPAIRVQWYYHWSELDYTALGIPESDFIYMGENELFSSDHEEIVYIGFIIGKCEVLTIQEYDNCEAIADNTYYSRAKFVTKEDRLEPPYNEWETLCSCNKPMNPNLLTVGWDRCDRWYHPKWEGLSDESIQDIDTFVCSRCRGGR